jgi:hypothetical protein
MGIRFSSQLCVESLRISLGMALYKVATLYIDEVRASMQTPEGADDIEDISLDDVGFVATAVAVTVVGGAWAVMDNYGKGSLMDTTNPALDDYRNSELWNPARHGYEIVGRPEGWYTNIFGKLVYSKGRYEGRVLEGMETRYGREIEPMYPSYAFQVAARWLENYRFAEVINNVLEEFSFAPFFITTL